MKTRLLALALLAMPLQACSVVMALSGEENPDLSAITIGATRGEVELHLGSPIKSVVIADGERTDVYEYEYGDEPSRSNAIAYGVMDIYFIGLWELVGTPIEGTRGEHYYATIEYDQDDKVTAFKTFLTEPGI